ncbi:unnamed protein product, partial [Rotaria magnacalcarata]
MAFNVNSNLLLGAGHYQANPRCQKVLTDHLVHSIENMSSTARRTLSAQSLQTTSSQETSCATPTPTTSTPHPHFPEFSTPQVS